MSAPAADQPMSETAAAAAGVGDIWVPYLDMVFDTDEKAYEFYCHYGRQMGFGVRKHLVKRRTSGAVYSRVFACYKEGVHRAAKEGKKPRPDARTGCKAHLTVRITEDGRFRVSEFDPLHNHDLAGKSPEAVTSTASDVPVVAPKPVSVPKLSAEELVNSTLPPGVTCLPLGNGVDENWVPKLNMEFPDDEEAYQFYVNYAIRIGFSVRKHLVKRRVSGIIYSRTYVCHREGHQRKDHPEGKAPKTFDRTGCQASLTIKIAKNGRYRVTEFQRKHNHPLVIPEKAHLFKWQWQRGLVRTRDKVMGLSDYLAASGNSSNETSDGQSERCLRKSFRAEGYKNYIPSTRENFTEVGDIGAVMQYAHEKQIEDPSFYYALQLDEFDQLTNFFWTDSKSMVDFNCFNEVLCFDTTYKTSGYGRPFTQFIGVNHHKQVITFGAALLYDETEESFKWLFDTFKTAMHGKQPKVVLTDRSVAMSNAIAAVWPGATHRLCLWHIYRNAAKHLNYVFLGSPIFAKDFSRFIYDIEEEEELESGWKTMIEKYDLSNNEWLAEIYKDRKKWALAYGRETFCADIKNTLTAECTNATLKENLYPERNLLDFFKHYETIVQERREAELQADFNGRKSIPKMPSLRMLRQAANAYTPSVFKMFEKEFEQSMDCMVYSCGQVETKFEYKVTTEDNPKEYIVRFDSSNGEVTCSCKKFEFVGIQCRHVMKTLDIINVKELPPQYILKRWTKDAKLGHLRGNCELVVDGENKPSQAKRYSSLCNVLSKIASRAAETEESYNFIETLSDQLMDQVCQILQTRPPEIP